ncbi:C39 family peptidase [Endozoicomonas sp. Mp262]|uniref:C39 family peptidase n=1 Tax=Endozoicomonas sp. Mp262 TaxID=2919499 RepID=UPI0021D98335
MTKERYQVESMLDTPFYSQRLTQANHQQEGFDSMEEAESWTKRICGLACLKMVIARITGEVVPLKALLEQGLAVDGYMKGVGWIHQGLLDVASEYGISGLCQSVGTELGIIDDELEKNRLVIASVSCGFNPEKKGGHLVLIIGIHDDGYIIHHPSSEEGEQWSHYRIDRARFLQSFSVNGNIITISVPEEV